MRYAKWNIVFEESLGTYPNELTGSFFINSTSVAGYIPDDFETSNYSKWSLLEITAQEFLDLALAVNSTSKLEDGFLVYEIPKNLKI